MIEFTGNCKRHEGGPVVVADIYEVEFEYEGKQWQFSHKVGIGSYWRCEDAISTDLPGTIEFREEIKRKALESGPVRFGY